MTGMTDSTCDSIRDIITWCRQHPGQWHTWPIAYWGRHAQRDAAYDMRTLQTGGYGITPRPGEIQFSRAHETFLDTDGAYRLRIRATNRKDTQ